MDRLGNQIWFFGSGSNNIEKLKIKLEFMFSYLANYEEIKRGEKFKYNIYILDFAPLHFPAEFPFFQNQLTDPSLLHWLMLSIMKFFSLAGHWYLLHQPILVLEMDKKRSILQIFAHCLTNQSQV